MLVSIRHSVQNDQTGCLDVLGNGVFYGEVGYGGGNPGGGGGGNGGVPVGSPGGVGVTKRVT